ERRQVLGRPQLPRRAERSAHDLERAHLREDRVDAACLQGRVRMATTAFDPKAFHDGLAAHGLIFPVGVLGAFGRSAVFEDVLDRLNDAITRIAANDGAEVRTYPPVIERKVLEQVDYMDSFPQLVGTVHSFFGKDKQAKELVAKIHAGEPW